MAGEIQIAVIGGGRFGRFWGKQLSRFYPVCFYDQDISKKEELSRLGSWESLENCLQKDYIFLTIPIGRIEAFLQTNSTKIKTGSVLIDCASVKVPVINWFSKYLPEDVYSIASHPLFGPDSARKQLAGHTMMLMPGRIPLSKYNFLVRLFTRNLGLHLHNLTAEEHDQLMAYNLNLVHQLGRTLDLLGISRLPLMMTGMKKLNEIVTVVMNDTPELFIDFHKYNPYSSQVRKEWEDAFNTISKEIDKNM